MSDAPRSADERKPVRLKDMIFMAEVEGYRIRDSERCSVMAKLRRAPCPKAIERAEVFEATARFLERLQPVLRQVLDLIKSAEASAGAKVERGGRDGGKRQGAV